MTMTNNVRRRRIAEWCGYLLIICSIVALDQYVKYLCRLRLAPIGQYDLWSGVFRLTYCENDGAAFSILAGKTWFFIVATVLLCAAILYLLIRDRVRVTAAKIALVCVFAGGIGNLIDRSLYGAVVDMFDFYLIGFAVFNVADIFVTCGCFVFILIFLFSKGKVLEA